jgi:hypothetical protein
MAGITRQVPGSGSYAISLLYEEVTTLANRLIRWLKEPLVHFPLIGAAIYVVYGLFGTAEESGDDLHHRKPGRPLDDRTAGSVVSPLHLI